MEEWTPPDPPLKAGSILLRPFEHRDAPAVVKACADEDIVRFTFMVEGTGESDAVEWIDRSNEWWPLGMPRFAIADTKDDQVFGQIGIAVNAHHRSAEAYYWVLAERRGQGVASAALGLVADWALAKGVERLHLLIHTDNDASNGLAERLGFAREGVLRAYEPFKGQRPDLVSWSLLPSDGRPWHQPN
jgi:[ribosomal protein S5]-alanine N-acetyltransferase